MAAPMSLAYAVGSGDSAIVEQLLQNGANPNKKSADGMTPLAVAAFWGYDTIVQLLIRNGADINSTNSGTLWTAMHCAAFQGHGRVVMTLMENKPDLYRVDSEGRSAIDFASALDSIWAFFAAAGCKRTPKADLMKMSIVRKVSPEDPTVQKEDILEFSRPGSAYVFNDRLDEQKQKHNHAAASAMGDVLAGIDDDKDEKYWNRKLNNPSLAVWNN